MTTYNNHGIDMEVLSKAVAERILKNFSGTDNESRTGWAQNSKYYGTELCGYVYNPYLVRRFIEKQFLELMKDYDLNVDKGIRCEYSYMDGIYYMIKEVRKLAMLEKYDKIAFEERKHFWSVCDFCTVFVDYFNNLKTHIQYLIDKNKGKTVYFAGRTIEVKKVPRFSTDCSGHVTILYKAKDDFLFNLADDYIGRIWSCKTYKELADLIGGVKIYKLPSKSKVQFVIASNGQLRAIERSNAHGFKHSAKFVEGFKKSGAYYTAKNKIIFDDLQFENRTGREAVDYLRSIIDEPAFIIYAKLKNAISK